jgi:DNA polymerase-3 subunit gamma/tau
MPYEITANRKRPQNFQQFKGQEFVAATLEASLQSGRIAHAYLFSGPRGCGKTSAARILAKSLNCEKGPASGPCGVCRSCVEIARGASLDVIEIDGASNTSVDNVRQIKDEVLFPPNGGKYKVYIIDEVHMLSNSAFNALLKTIEEPPPYIVFIFATTELHKVPATIKSRCQQFAFRLFPIDLVKSLLAEAASEIDVEAEDDALLWIAKESGGSLRDAYTLFDQVVSFSEGKLSASLIRDKLGLVGLEALNALFASCAAGDSQAAFTALDGILARGISAEQCAVDGVEYFRSLLLLANGIDKASLLGAPASAYDASVLKTFGAEKIERALAILLALYRDLRYCVDPRFELELAVARLSRLSSFVSPSELSDTLSSLKRLVAGGAPTSTHNPVAAGVVDAARAEERAEARGAPIDRGDSEKKKLELPPSLRSAFGSLALAAGVDDGGGESAPTAPEAPAQSVVESAPNAPAATATISLPFLAESFRSNGRVVEDPESAEDEDADSTFESESLTLENAVNIPAAGQAASPAGPSRIEGDGLSDSAALRAAVIEALGRSSPLLKTGLTQSLPWRIEGDHLVIPFRSGIEESVVRGSVADIAAKAAELGGPRLRVELKVERPAQGESRGAAEIAVNARDPASAVERVFRGTRVAYPARKGGSDEFR